MILAFNYGRSFKYLTPLNNDAYFGSYQNGSSGPTPPPPTSNPYVIGTGMVQQGTSILLQGTAPLINKGTVRDQLNVIPH